MTTPTPTPTPTTDRTSTSTAEPRTPFRVLVTGSRTWTDTDAIATVLDAVNAVAWTDLVIVHGGCRTGADAIADRWARRRGVEIEVYPADWTTGRGAGPARNAAMIFSNPALCLAFIRDASPGATGCADMAETAGIPTRRYTRGAVQVDLHMRPAVTRCQGDPAMTRVVLDVLDEEIVDGRPDDNAPCRTCGDRFPRDDLDENQRCGPCAADLADRLDALITDDPTDHPTHHPTHHPTDHPATQNGGTR